MAIVKVESGTVRCEQCGLIIHLGWTDEIPLPADAEVTHNNLDGTHKVVRGETPVPAAFHEQS